MQQWRSVTFSLARQLRLPSSLFHNICHKSVKQKPLLLNFLENFLHSLFTPLSSLKCVPLLPQCWAMRILEHWDDCHIQINIGEGQTHTIISRFLTSIVALFCSSIAPAKIFTLTYIAVFLFVEFRRCANKESFYLWKQENRNSNNKSSMDQARKNRKHLMSDSRLSVCFVASRRKFVSS